jgi:predicted nuclease of restriction endonuclease-like (RecB) superfamily
VSRHSFQFLDAEEPTKFFPEEALISDEQAEEIAQETTIHTDNLVVNEMTINKPQVIEYLSGDY